MNLEDFELEKWQLDPALWVTDPTRTCAPIFLDKRLGKCTLAILWWNARTPAPRNGLVVAPMSAFNGWLYWLEKHGQPPGIILEGTREQRYEALLNGLNSSPENGPQTFIVNPQGLFYPGKGKFAKPTPTEIGVYPFDFVVWDESTMGLANPSSQQNWMAQKYLARIPHRAVLSGEFVPQRVEQCFEQLKFVYGEFMGHRNFYQWRLANFEKRGYEWRPKDIGMIRAEVNKVAYILSKSSAGVEPKRHFDRMYVKLPDHIRRDYDKIDKEFSLALDRMIDCPICGGSGWRPDGGDVEVMCGYCEEGKLDRLQTKTATTVYRWLRQITGGYPDLFPHLHSDHKLGLLEEYILDLNAPMVATFVHTSELNAAYKRLSKNRKVGYINGSLPPAHRRKVEGAFRSGNGPSILLAQVKCVCHGSDLSASDTMGRYSLPDRYEEISQPLDRIFDQANPGRDLFYADFICKDTVDEKLVKAAVEHGATARSFMSALYRR